MLAYEHDAVAEHQFDLDAPGRLAAAHAEGRGDALLMERYPFARLSLAVSWSPPPRGLRGRLVFRVLGAERMRPLAVAVLGVLEAAKLRRRWARAFDLVQRASYARGLREGGARVHERRRGEPVRAGRAGCGRAAAGPDGRRPGAATRGRREASPGAM